MTHGVTNNRLNKYQFFLFRSELPSKRTINEEATLYIMNDEELRVEGEVRALPSAARLSLTEQHSKRDSFAKIWVDF